MTVPRHPARDTNEQFLDRLRDLAMDWRWSDEFIGGVVRMRWAKERDHSWDDALNAAHEANVDDGGNVTLWKPEL